MTPFTLTLTLFFTLSLTLSLLHSSTAQVSRTVRPQPPSSLVRSLDLVRQCCPLLDDPQQLLACSNNTRAMTPSPSLPHTHTHPTTTVSLVTYLDSDKGQFNIPDIFKFGAYMVASTAAYAELHDYSFRWLTRATGSNHQPGDARWNKVKIIDEALDPETGWAKDSEYLVWMDGDAIVLDMGLKIEEVGKQYPQADFICSADIRQGLLNSGFLVMRNTKWLRNFVKEWWEVVDRSVKCDQDAFDVLYERYVQDAELGKHWRGDVRTKVAVLARDALNSDPPAMSHQKDYNQVLHLMGEVTPMREGVFRKAFSAICATTTNDEGRLPLQLGATQSFLLHTAEDVYSTRTASLMDAAREHQGVEDFNALSVSVHHLSDIYKQMRLLNKHSHLFTEVYNMTVAWREKFEKKLAQKGSAVTADDMTTYINLLKRVAENSNDYFQSLRDHRRKEEVAISTLEALDRMFDSVGTESKPFVRHMSALMLTNLGEMYYDAWVDLGAKQSSDEGELYLQLVVDKQEAAVEYFQEYLEDVDNKSIQNEYSMALQLLAIAYSNQNDMMNARSIWKRAIEKSVKITNGVEMGPYYSSLSRLYFNAAVCDMKGKFFTDAKEKLLKMMVVAINSGQVTEAQLNVKPFEGPPELKTALAMLKEISMKDPAVRSRSVETEIEEEWEDCEEGEEGCEEVFELVDTEPSKTIDDVVDDDNDDDDEDDEEELRELAEIRAQYARQSQGVSERRNMDENEEEEWEECVEGEEGCEEVEEDSEGHIIPSAVKVKVSSLQELDEEYEECFPGEEGCEELEVEIVDDDNDDDDEDDEEELRELAEIRAQYARQSQGVSERRNMDENEEEEWEECVEGEEGCEEVEEDSEGHIIPSAVKVKVSSLQELDEEYEECFPGEEGCEELEVEIVEGHRDRDHFEAAGGDDDDEDDEELRELAEIRSQYARQSRERNNIASV